jgi:hypothetical protein
MSYRNALKNAGDLRAASMFGRNFADTGPKEFLRFANVARGAETEVKEILGAAQGNIMRFWNSLAPNLMATQPFKAETQKLKQ